MRRAVLVLALLAASAAMAQAQVYKWQDADGRSHYSDLPPPAQKAAVANTHANVIETEKAPFQTKAAALKNPVVLYSAASCKVSCSQAQALLEQRGVPYALKDATVDAVQFKQLFPQNQLPVLVVGKQSQVGFEAGLWNRMLDNAGYPKTNPLAGMAKMQPARLPAATKPAATPEQSSQAR